jgi:hypothetical protein
MPSPVATGGFVVAEKTWPMPPLESTTARHLTAPTPSSCPSPITCRVTPATAPSGASSRSRARACSMTTMSGAAATAATRARWISAPVASPPAWSDAPAQVAALPGQGELAGRGLVELGAQRDQLPHRVGPLGDEGAHGVLVTQARAGDEGVLEVLLRGVPGAEGGGDAALGPGRRPGGEEVLGDDQDAAAGHRGVDPQRRGQAGDAGSDHDHVGVLGPAGLRGSSRSGRTGPFTMPVVDSP